MTNFLSRWSWLDDGVLPGLVAIIRTCWIWPWLVIAQYGLAPETPAAALPAWLVLALPLLSFGLARWASTQPAASGESASSVYLERFPSHGRDERLPWGPRLGVGLAGIVLTGLVVWWQLYQDEFSLFNSEWLTVAGDSLIHWPETSVPPAVLLILTALILWLKGLLDAGLAFTHDSVWSAFLVGIVMMVLYLMTISLADLDLVGQLITSVLIMLVAGMGALAFSSIKITAGLDRALGFGVRQLDKDSPSARNPTSMAALKSEAMPVVNRYWFLNVGGAIGLLTLLGILLTLLIAPELLQALFDGLWAVATFIGDILFNLILLLAYASAIVFFYLYSFLEPYLKRLMEQFDLDPELLEGLQQEREEPLEPAEVIERAPVPDEYRWLGLLIFGVITVIVFALVIRRLSKTETETLDEDRESILSSDLLQNQLNSLWDRLRGRFARQDPDDPFLPLEGEETRRRIRSVYQALLLAATELGTPRQPALTPVEYENRLVKRGLTKLVSASKVDAGPKHGSGKGEPLAADLGLSGEGLSTIQQIYGEQFADQLEVITAGYVAARYGNEAPPSELADSVEESWREIAAGLKPEEDTKTED